VPSKRYDLLPIVKQNNITSFHVGLLSNSCIRHPTKLFQFFISCATKEVLLNKSTAINKTRYGKNMARVPHPTLEPKFAGTEGTEAMCPARIPDTLTASWNHRSEQAVLTTHFSFPSVLWNSGYKQRHM
jgi:hypothetical protein